MTETLNFSLAALTVVLAGVAGVVLTVLTLPGIWLALLVALLVNLFWQPGMFDWWTLGACGVLAIVAEVVEFAASAVGAAKAGGSKRGAIGSVFGALLGAIGGTFLIPVPVVGTILGGALGAGLGAFAFERHGGKRTWGESVRVGQGAAVGRLLATLAKTGFAVAVALILGIAAFF